MKSTSPVTLSLLSLLLSHRSSAAADICGGVIDGTDNFNNYAGSTVTLLGDFIITNVGTQKSIVYQHNTQAEFLVTDDPLSEILDALGDGPSKSATNVITLFATGDKYGSMGMMGKGSGRCVSCQWGFQNGDCDRYGAAYNCIDGPDAVEDTTLEINKPRFFFIPMNTDQSSNAVEDDAVSTFTGCPKTSDWLNRHAKDVEDKNGGYLDRHPGCIPLMGSNSDNSKMRRRYRRTQHFKKGGNDDNTRPFQIVTLDHLTDMVAMCLSGTQKTAFAGAAAVALANCDPTDQDQMWNIVSA